MLKSSHTRVSKELKEIINYIRAKYLLAGRKPPSSREITRRIARKVNKEKLWEDEFIKI